jgi:hypothetical protein
MSEVICTECGLPMYVDPNAGFMETCVGYFSPPGHNHDDNCRSTVALCDNGHRQGVSVRRTCPNPDCDWKGKEECFCHQGRKLDEWPVR